MKDKNKNYIRKDVLIVVDMQNDFITGKLGTKEAMDILPRVREKIARWQGRVIYTRDTHLKETYLKSSVEGSRFPIHCVKGSEGWEVEKSLIGLSKNGETYIDKYNTFADPMVAMRCSGVDRIEIIGVCTDICVLSTAIAFRCAHPEIGIYIDASCCAGTTPAKHRAALDVMRGCCINVINDYNRKGDNSDELYSSGTKNEGNTEKI